MIVVTLNGHRQIFEISENEIRDGFRDVKSDRVSGNEFSTVGTSSLRKINKT